MWIDSIIVICNQIQLTLVSSSDLKQVVTLRPNSIIR